MKIVSGKFLLFLVPFFHGAAVLAQKLPTSGSKDSVVYPPGCYQKFDARKLIVPATMIAYGFVALHVASLTYISEGIQEETWDDHPHNTTTIDNYLQFAPAVAVYALNLAGIKGEHNFVDRSMIYLMSNLIMEGFVAPIKNWSHELRPNGEGYESFPSGHTAEAFVSATFLYEEYKNVSIWYGVGGYLVAGTVGALRIYNDKHWFHDVVAGAGFGIISTKAAYLVYPYLRNMLTHTTKQGKNTMVMPTYQNGVPGLSFAMQL